MPLRALYSCMTHNLFTSIVPANAATNIPYALNHNMLHKQELTTYNTALDIHTEPILIFVVLWSVMDICVCCKQCAWLFLLFENIPSGFYPTVCVGPTHYCGIKPNGNIFRDVFLFYLETLFSYHGWMDGGSASLWCYNCAYTSPKYDSWSEHNCST